MTALERLIKTASIDAAPHYRAMARESQMQFDHMIETIRFYADGKHFDEVADWNSFKMGEGPPPPELLDRGEIARNVLEVFPFTPPLPERPVGMKREDFVETITVTLPPIVIMVPKDACTPPLPDLTCATCGSGNLLRNVGYMRCGDCGHTFNYGVTETHLTPP